MVVVKCLKLIWNHSGIISGTYFSPLSESITYTGVSGGLREAIFWPYFGILNNFPHFLESIILLYILDSIEWIFQIWFWIEFLIESFLGPIQWKMNFQNGLARAKILLTSSVSGQRSSLASSPSLSPSIAESQVHDKMEQSWVMSSIFLVRLFSCYERRRAATRYLMRVVHTIRWYSYSALKAWTCDLWPDLTWTMTSTVTHWATILRFLTAIWMLQL